MSEQQRSVNGTLSVDSPIIGTMQATGTVYGNLFMPPAYDTVRTFDTVADMQEARDLDDGAVCHTLGFYSIGDGGASWYKMSGDGVANGRDVLECVSLNAHLVIAEPYVKPEQFGAYGDGTHDDTVALQYVMKYSSDNKMQVVFANKYIVTDSLNKYDGQYINLTVNILGKYRKHPSNYSIAAGGIKLNAAGSIFKNATIDGTIDSCLFVGARSDSYVFFYDCAAHIDFRGNYVANFGAMFLNCHISSVSHIDDNVFVSVFNFMKLDKEIVTSNKSTIVDSTITNNYINGGMEPTDNAFMENSGMNGCIVANNFIDYYKVMYRFKRYESGSFTWQGGVSTGNQYQVFLYFYKAASGQQYSSVSFTSVSDCFNWTSETASTTKAKFDAWTRDKYTGRDGTQYNTPNYIFRPMVGQIKATDAIIQSNVGNYMFFNNAGMADYEYNVFDITLAGSANLMSGSSKIAYSEGGASAYNAGSFKQNAMRTNLVTKVESVPNVTSGWSKWCVGSNILYNNVIYTLLPVNDGGTWSWKWLDRFGNQAV